MKHQHNGTSRSTQQDTTTKFQGAWTPAQVYDLLAEGKVTTTEVVLLGIVDSLVRNSKGEGCWASNEYLAERLGGLRPDWVKEMIRKLKELGLLQQVGWKVTSKGRYRVLETAWSRIEGGGGSITPDPPREGGYNPRPPHPATALVCNNTLLQPSACNSESVSSCNGDGCTPNGHATRNGHTSNSTPQKEVARLLHTTLSKKGKVVRQANITAWAKELLPLIKAKGRAAVECAIREYGEHCDEEYWPLICSARSFVDKFASLERQIKKFDPDAMAPPTTCRRIVTSRNTGKPIEIDDAD